jgi:tetratricopeptide (TPR) repeat protein
MDSCSKELIVNRDMISEDFKSLKVISNHIRERYFFTYMFSHEDSLLILKKFSLSKYNIEEYNNIAYQLEQGKNYSESIYLLEKIIEKFPNRTVAYLNLGDAYIGMKDKVKAKKAYQIYIKQMRQKGLEKQIPKRILD